MIFFFMRMVVVTVRRYKVMQRDVKTVLLGKNGSGSGLEFRQIIVGYRGRQLRDYGGGELVKVS